jgi:hypothetical protein
VAILIPPENIHAAKKILADCCGRMRPDLLKLAHLLGLGTPPRTYTTGGTAFVPLSGVRAFSVWAIEKLGGTVPTDLVTLPAALSSLLDAQVPKR